MMNPRRSSRRRGAIALLIAALVGLGLVIAFANREGIEERVVEPAPPATPFPAAPEVSSEERALYQFVAPRLAGLIAEADALEALGRERSRNLVELQVRSDRVNNLADDIDAYLAAHAAPPRLQPLIDQYTVAIEQVRSGMLASRSAFTRFDWDAVAAGLDQFSAGVTELRSVLAGLQATIGGSATPAAAAARSWPMWV
jgi:hypothetical protein